MSYLQDDSFLDTFPDRANIIPSFYSIPGEANTVWRAAGWSEYKPNYCNRNREPQPPLPPNQPDQRECCYVCLIPPTAVTLALPDPNVKMGMIGHYYMIDARFEPIIHMGFPMNNPYSGMRAIKDEPDYVTEVNAYFPTNQNHPYYTFSRNGSQYDTTYPYIFCFTTCCLTTPCAMFDLFLDPERYKKTFWCQGFQDFTTLLAVDPTNPANPANPRVLSPVLHVVIGSMLSEPDFYLSGFRYGILNVTPLKNYLSTSERLDEYKRSTQILMTLETSQETVSIYQPSIDPYPRRSALLAFKTLRDKINQVNIEYKRRLFPEQPQNVIQQRSLVMDKVEKKINMIKIIAQIFFYYNNTQQLDANLIGTLRNILARQNTVTELQVIITKINNLVAANGALFISSKIVELYTATTQLLQGNQEKTASFYANIGTVTAGIDLDNEENILKAVYFILECPSVAATAAVEYVTSAIKFKEDLIDYALLCLKKNWLGGMMNNAYETDTTVFGQPHYRKLYYLSNTGDFVYMGDNIFTCIDPSNPPTNTDLYVHKSSFDEVKTEGRINNPVTVLTLANIYRLDCYYTKIPGNIVKSMSIVYQVSSTIVYTRQVNPVILNAIDMQKIPLGFLPDLPEVLGKIPKEMKQPILDTEITTVKNVLQQGTPLSPEIISQSESLKKEALQRRKPTRAKDTLTILEQRGRRTTRAQGGGAGAKRKIGDQHQREQKFRQDLEDKDSLVERQLRDKVSKDISLLELEGELERELQGTPDVSKLYSFLSSGYTSCATHRRVASYGAFFAGKMMEYFFNQYIQLPSFFKYFESYLKQCFQYSTTALIYDANVPPYNLIQIQPPLTPGAPPPTPPSFTLQFFLHFQKMGISFNAAATPDNPSNAQQILATLQAKTAYIKAISNFLTNDFMIDEGAADNIQTVVDHFSQPSGSTHTTKSNASISTASSTRSEMFCSFDLEDITNSDALCIFLLEKPLEESECGDDNYQDSLLEDDDDDDDYEDGDEDGDRIGGGNKPRLATVAITKRNRKYKTRSSPKRKSKSNNKSKSRHKRNSKITNKTFCRKRKSYLSRKPHKKQTLKKGVKR